MPGIIFGNRVLDVVFIAWFMAQFYKVISSLIIDKKLKLSRLWDTGGMPSSHSSTVSCLATIFPSIFIGDIDYSFLLLCPYLALVR